jgi:hypothetical protein
MKKVAFDSLKTFIQGSEHKENAYPRFLNSTVHQSLITSHQLNITQ